MDSARHVTKPILLPRLLSQTASFDVASTIHRSLDYGQLRVKKLAKTGRA